jgi:hypothetical protein
MTDMVKVVHFESAVLPDSVFSNIRDEMRSVAERPDMKEAPHEKILKESLKSMTERVSDASIPVHAPVPIVSEPNTTPSSFPAYLLDDEDTTKAVEALLTITLEHGLDRAIAEAKRANHFVLDAFHDTLVEKFLPELQKRGMLD